MEDVQKTEADPSRFTSATRQHNSHEKYRLRRGYNNAHNFEEKVTDMSCLPENLRRPLLVQTHRPGLRTAPSRSLGRNP